MEHLQHDAAYYQVFPALEGTPRASARGNVILVADVEEIVHRESLIALKTYNFSQRLTLISYLFRYSYQFFNVISQWPHPQATYVSN